MFHVLAMLLALGAASPRSDLAADIHKIKAGRIDAARYDYGRLFAEPKARSSLTSWATKIDARSGVPGRPWVGCGSNRQARYVRAWTSAGGVMSPDAFAQARAKVLATLAGLEVRARKERAAARDAETTAIGGRLAGLAAADQIWMGQALIEWSDPDEDTSQLFAAVLEARACDFERKEAVELKEILAVAGWPSALKYGEPASENAWLIAQHVDHDPALQRQALARLEVASGRGEAKPEHFAYLADRVAANAGMPQRFGTQLRCIDGKMAPAPLVDAAHVDALRRAYGLAPLADYLKAFQRPCR